MSEPCLQGPPQHSAGEMLSEFPWSSETGCVLRWIVDRLRALLHIKRGAAGVSATFVIRHLRHFLPRLNAAGVFSSFNPPRVQDRTLHNLAWLLLEHGLLARLGVPA